MESSKLKALVMTCGLLLAAGVSQAQTFAEWWSQKKTQIKYLARQIAALEVYGSYLKQGYKIAGKGLGNIAGFTGSEFSLHSDYYKSLKTVNPLVKDNPEAAAIAQYATAIPAEFDYLKGFNGLDEADQKYIGSVAGKVLEECSNDIAELQLVMTSGETEMTDDERLKRLHQVSTRIKDKYAFTLNFRNQVRMLLAQRNRELQNIQTLRRYYEIN
ncbi:hypothetical protein [Mucilaginibacter sp. L3T2-6]|uniref:hypothetical protein n=1 Tax=Mucilaginibacter sp. L3T2-6 TaxID=3062491 RepID=UPI0026769ECB|nr:hypothetical protein [Mucilaginibacter sp. L3T2-6]MDO3641518.1 hypothetical protein [Mucilaginibacter sp. L3T2-6]MDV6213721.1 hypothetical protein [Mucilaginibacter sp. L3T2-6]